MSFEIPLASYVLFIGVVFLYISYWFYREEEAEKK